MPIAFDAFGTLFRLDWLREQAGDDLYQAFYERLQPWTWLATAAGAYRPLPELAEQAFASAAAAVGAEVDAGELAGKLTQLPLYPDAIPALDALAGERLAVSPTAPRAAWRASVERRHPPPLRARAGRGHGGPL